ncbi:Fc receptor-like protein 5 [Carassius carassius]|uniref:Fc receptor-like protein 5 n=1 Tax=Carassius carassius TaxID=217509 RepID=UPI0028695212|nr:Fc receptor-like protein 5 [Carassius carassius]
MQSMYLSVVVKKEGEELGHSGEAQSRAAAPLHREEPAKVARVSVTDAFWTHSWGSVLGTSHREEASGKTEDTLEGIAVVVKIRMTLSLPIIFLLMISALQVKAAQLVLEKQTVNLTCETTCNLTDRFIWYKNGQTLHIQSKTLQLQSERSDSGHYSCAARGHEHLHSPAVSITAMYPPQSVSVSISPSGVIVEGDSVTLSCSSDSNPPALIFRWFKENQSSAVGSGQSFIISSFNSRHSGRYSCEAQNQHGSQRSDSVSVAVEG